MDSKAFDVTRWRSFAERYLIERAATFEPGEEVKGIWQETLNALTAYQHIYHVGMANDGKDIAIPAAVPAVVSATETDLSSLLVDRNWYQNLASKLPAW